MVQHDKPTLAMSARRDPATACRARETQRVSSHKIGSDRSITAGCTPLTRRRQHRATRVAMVSVKHAQPQAVRTIRAARTPHSPMGVRRSQITGALFF
jgi:hypothetical protein